MAIEELEGAGASGSCARVQELEGELLAARQARERAEELVEKAREGSVWSTTWEEVRRVIVDGVERVIAERDERERLLAAGEVAAQAERVARGVVEYALKGVRAAEEVREQAEVALREAERRRAEAGEQQRRTEWLIEQRRAAPQQGPLACAERSCRVSWPPSAARPSMWRTNRPSAFGAPSGCAPSAPATPRFCLLPGACPLR